MKIINLNNLLILLTLTLIWFGLLLVSFYFKTKSKDDKKTSRMYFQSRKFKLSYDKRWFVSLDNYLKESGYMLTPEMFILIHLLVMVIVVYSVLKLGLEHSSRSIIPLLSIVLLLVNLLISKRIKDRKNRIRLELCNIQDVMYFQNKIGTAEDIILTYASKIAKEPLKEPLECLATAPKVKKTVENALEDLRKVSNVVELQSFSFILQQRQETGSAVESHKAQSQMMKRNKRLRRKIGRQYKRTKLLVASFMLFGCYVLLLTVPLLVEAMRSLDLMFR